MEKNWDLIERVQSIIGDFLVALVQFIELIEDLHCLGTEDLAFDPTVLDLLQLQEFDGVGKQILFETIKQSLTGCGDRFG